MAFLWENVLSQNKKKDLFNKVVSDDGNILTKLTNEELLSLFNIQPK